MSIGLFKRPYTVRQYGPQKIIRGHAASPHTDKTIRLNVQSLNPDELLTVPEGDRTVKRVKAFGSDMLTSADEFTGTPGDRLFYRGLWYECKSSVPWDHTFILNHYRSEFAVLKEQEDPPQEVTTP